MTQLSKRLRTLKSASRLEKSARFCTPRTGVRRMCFFHTILLPLAWLVGPVHYFKWVPWREFSMRGFRVVTL